MKRISIAEQTLKKQIDLFYKWRAELDQKIADLTSEQRAYDRAITDLETEQSRLRAQRESSSERNTKS